MSKVLYISDEKDLAILRTPIMAILATKRVAKVEIKTSMLKNDPRYGYYFGVILPRIKAHFETTGNGSWTLPDIDQYLKQMFFYEEKEINGEPVRIIKSKENVPPEEFSEFLRRVRRWCLAKKIFIPEPMN